ncbi:MAG: metallophosphoesterase [Actinomycetota bacterium]|nr:metallophosphoesterase [Actinomycetota bacterium]
MTDESSDIVRVPFDGDGAFRGHRMVRWLGPSGLTTTAMQVLLSTIFGAYSDKREIQAALKESGESDLSGRDELWFDFLADTGDGFNATYTTACLLNQDFELSYAGGTVATKRSDLLVLGGDLAYPAATPESYRDRFIGPYQAAFPEPRSGQQPTTMVACAGNHDWYDGLTTFLRLFCEGKRIGGWKTEQTRSYFTVKLPHGWWIMAIDLAFDFFIDEPQMAFFRREASERLAPADKVILVTHRPSWLFHQLGDDQLRSPMARTNLQQFEDDIIHAHGLRMPLVLAGDIHHYNRYASADRTHQRITAGAGAAFLYPTNHLQPAFSWPEAEGVVGYEQQAVYPDARTSRRLRWGTLLAPFKNPSFMVFVGGLYVVFALLVRFALTGGSGEGFTETLRLTDYGDVSEAVFNNPNSFLFAIALLAIMIGFADAPSWPWRTLVGVVHWVVHFVLLVVVLGTIAVFTVEVPFDLEIHYVVKVDLTLDTPIFVAGVAVAGAYLSSQVFALYLFLMFSLCGRHATHAFSSQHIANYRSFLRLKIDADGSLTVYPVAVRKVPRRWRRRNADRQPGEPLYEPADGPVECELIEPPIRIE